MLSNILNVKNMQLHEAKDIMGANMIGPAELRQIGDRMSIEVPHDAGIPDVPFGSAFLQKFEKDFLLILAVPGVSIDRLRSCFGTDPKKSEPCFYDQDWYMHESFAKRELELAWHLLRTAPLEESRARDPQDIEKGMGNGSRFPSASLVAFAFFSRYLLTGETLFKTDFVWCGDTDTNGDRIYVGRYVDPKSVSKNGFSVHRHLTIRNCYGFAPEIAQSQ